MSWNHFPMKLMQIGFKPFMLNLNRQPLIFCLLFCSDLKSVKTAAKN